MKKLWGRILLLVTAATALAAGNTLFDRLDRGWNAPVRFRFRHPLPAMILERYGITNTPTVEHVFITGPFCDWEAQNPRFEMKKTENGEWAISLRLHPGRNQYKFVIQTREVWFDKVDRESRRLIWTHDPASRLQDPDSFGGLNSAVEIPAIRTFAFFWNLAVGGLCLVILLSLILEPVVHFVMQRRLRFRTKLVLSVFLLGAVSSLIIAGFNVDFSRKLTREAFTESIHLVHVFMENSGVRLTGLTNAQETARTHAALVNLFRETAVRTEKYQFSNRQFNLNALLLLDAEFRPLLLAAREDAEKTGRLAMEKLGYRSLEDLYRRGYFGAFLDGAAKNRVTNTFEALFASQSKLPDSSRPAMGDFLERFAGYNAALVPIVREGRVEGYWAASLHTDLFGAEILRLVFSNVLLVILGVLIVLILLSRTGDLMTDNLGKLRRGMSEIRKGNLDYPVEIKSGDEFEELGAAYNFMRGELGTALAKLETYRRDAERDAGLLSEHIARREISWDRENKEMLVFQGEAMSTALENLEHAAKIRKPALITGETGTGKELVARILHKKSAAPDAPFIALNCAAVPEALWESEIFGHVKGAFTDAKTAREGAVARAGNGTLFFDEAGEIPLNIQAKLLRLVQEGTYTAVGDVTEIRAGCRFLFATNRDLTVMTKEGGFREDLYYRISVFHLALPPLRDRAEDIPALVQYFLARYAPEFVVEVTRVETTALESLRRYRWPGNIRELENLVIRLLATKAGDKPKTGETWFYSDLPASIASADPSKDKPAETIAIPSEASYEEKMKAYSSRLIRAALEKSGGNKAQAAKLLGMKRPTLIYQMKELGLD